MRRRVRRGFSRSRLAKKKKEKGALAYNRSAVKQDASMQVGFFQCDYNVLEANDKKETPTTFYGTTSVIRVFPGNRAGSPSPHR